MEEKKIKSINFYMRSWHRDIGFFVIGLVIIFSMSGIILINRDTDFLKHDRLVETTLSTNMNPSEISNELHLKDFKNLRT